MTSERPGWPGLSIFDSQIMNSTTHYKQAGFTFVELVIVIAVVGIMSALAIGSFSEGASDAREIVARQQQAAIQSAVNAWVASELTSRNTVADVRSDYNSATTSEARLNKVRAYLDQETYDHIFENDQVQPSDEISTSATRRLDWHIALPAWAAGSYPQVRLNKFAP